MPTRREAVERIGQAYDRYASGLYRYAVMLLGDPASAADAVQHVFTAWLRTGAGVEDAERYLRRAVRNECYSALRRRARQSREDPILEPVDRAAATVEERLALERALRALPADQREVIHLKIYEGMTFAEIADVIDAPLNTVASRYRYAIEKLRELLQPLR